MLALFPLQLVVYPGERLALHIFEERYQQLVKDCETDEITFGVPTYIDKKLEYGTEVQLKKVEKRYKDGQSDIVCTGKRIFKIEDFYKQAPGKLYAGGNVTFLENNLNSDASLQEELLQHINELYYELQIEDPPQFKLPLTSYKVAHKIGLALSQEYHLLTLPKELDRLQYLVGHLKVTIPVVREMNRTKEVIQMNGHFKNFDPLDFEDFEL
ncbi:LON peptidase substrate-binding domain-containing protein [Aquimarina sp. ERC-38]|uniref:LON peptidase substrate-binding domain-containing protein n=1 Tax=Aquimarina sp. ERC-38 TaxID=2949996 RepID=UPI0022469710|nr:LON peptidase substrate-binding domain-containing protein [Aquimarina sp. ERC-38]UZO79338.1 LON peptidase substrate-binding domain-containing protein [Aquimarina sp. ERC-38]